MDSGFTTRVLFDQAQQAYRTAQAAVDDAKAQLEIAEDRVGYTELKANVSGTITARGAEAGEVVQAGQMVFQVARDTGWDAVFDVPAQVIRTAPPNAEIVIALTDDPSVTAKGRVRQVDPQADPVTRTFKVRVSVNDPPARHAAWRDRHRAPGHVDRNRHLDPGERAHCSRPQAGGLGRRSQAT